MDKEMSKIKGAGKILLAILCLALLSGIAFAACPTGMVGYWKLDDSSGATVSDSANGLYSGTISGNQLWASTSECKVGKCLRFDGSNYVQLNSATNTLGNGWGELTVMAWVKYNSQYRGSFIDHGNGEEWQFTLRGGTGLENQHPYQAAINDNLYRYSGVHRYYMTSDTPTYDGQWHFLAATYKRNGYAYFYVDGVQQNTYVYGDSNIGVNLYNSPKITRDYPLIDLDNPITIGARAAYTDMRMVGYLDEIAVFDRVLSQSEIQQLYQNNQQGLGYCAAAAPPEPPTCGQNDTQGMISYWKMDETSGTTASDSKDSNPGTLSSGASFVSGKVGNAVYISLGNEISVPMSSNSNLKIPGTSSHEMWINVTQYLPHGVGRMLLYRAPDGSSYTLTLGATGGEGGIPQGNIGLCLPGYCWVNTGVHLNLNTWYHLVMTHESDNTVKIYVNGVLSYTTPPLTFDFSPYNIFEIGWTDQGTNAIFDEVAVYNKALSVSDIQAHITRSNSGNHYCTAAPLVCGNNAKETGEACDGTDLGAETCASQTGGQLPLGTLSCNAQCSGFVTSQCRASAPSGCPAGMISYWKGDGSADDIGGLNSGSWAGTASYSSGVPGITGQAFNFVGNNHVNIQTNTFPIGNSPRTIEAWINLADCSVNTNIPLIYGQPGGGHVFGLVANCNEVYMQGYNFNYGITASPLLSTNTWYYLVLSFDGTTVKIYVNGMLRGSGTIVNTDYGTASASSMNTILGSQHYMGYHNFYGESYSKAKVDEVAIYNRALTDGGCSVGQACGGEVGNHYNGGVGKDYCAAAPPNPNLIQNSTGGTVEDQGIKVEIPPGSLGTTELLVDIVESVHSFAPVVGITNISQPLDIGPQCADIGDDQSTCESTNGCRFNELGMCESIPFSSPVTITMPGDCTGAYGDLITQKIAKYNPSSGTPEPVSTCDPIGPVGGIWSCPEPDGRVMTWNTNTCKITVRVWSFSTYAVVIQVPVCGNGAVESGEECDMGDLNGQDCSTQGYVQGEIVCTAECTFDASGCLCQLPAPPCSKSDGVCSGLEMQCMNGEWADCTEGDYQSNSPFYSITENTVDTCWDGEDNDCNGLADKDELGCLPGGLALQTCTVNDMIDFNGDGTVDSFDALIVLRSIISYPNQVAEPKDCQAIILGAA
jgi:hypothetical protein